MATYQVEEYYVHMSGLELTQENKTDIEAILSEEGYSDYEFQDNDTVLVVDGIEDQHSGENLESMIEGAIS